MSEVVTDYVRPDVIAAIDNKTSFFDEYLDFLIKLNIYKRIIYPDGYDTDG